MLTDLSANRWERDCCWDMQEGSTMVTPGYEQTEAGGGVAMTTGSNDQGTGFGPSDQAQFEADKRSVYK
jgi:hypothetical protein